MSQKISSRKCKINRIRAGLAEDAILKSLDEVLTRNGCLAGIHEKLAKRSQDVSQLDLHSKTSAVAALSEIEREISGILRLSSQITDGPAVELIKEKLENLAASKSQKKEWLQELEDKIEAQEAAIERTNDLSDSEILKAFWRGWTKATPTMKKQLVRALFEEIIVTENGMEARFRVFSQSPT